MGRLSRRNSRAVQNGIVKRLLLISLILVLTLGCGHKAATFEPGKQYSLSGKIVALDAAKQVATIDAAAIPNYMEAMTMEYPVKSADDFKVLHVGDHIKGTLNVSASGDEYNLTQVQVQPPGNQ